MTLDDLGNVYEDAWFAAMRKSGNPRQAGIAVVVRALRDEMAPKSLDLMSIKFSALRELFNEILGDEEKAAGGTIREDVLGAASPVRTPAADPVLHSPALGRFVQHESAADPKVCVWTRKLDETSCGYFVDRSKHNQTCPHCNMNIKFQEQQP